MKYQIAQVHGPRLNEIHSSTDSISCLRVIGTLSTGNRESIQFKATFSIHIHAEDRALELPIQNGGHNVRTVLAE